MHPEAIGRIEALAADAETRQGDEIAEATAAALDHVPRALRRITRKVLGI